MRRSTWIVAVALLAMAVLAVAAESSKMTMKNYPVRGGANDPVVTAPVVDGMGHADRGTLDSIGTVYLAGTSYYDQQHNGSAGKMIGVDELGFVHMAWMKGQTSDNNGPRHVFYQLWDPNNTTEHMVFLSGGIPSGQVIDAATRAGYVSVCLMQSGWFFPSFHETRPGDPGPHSAAAIDLMSGMGIFNSSQPAYLYENGSSLQLIWPKIAVGRDSVLHMVSCESPASGEAGDYQRIYYSRGVPTWDTDGLGVEVDWQPVDGVAEFKMIDTVMVIGPVIVTSRHSDRVAIVWPQPRSEDITVDSLRTQYNNDLYAMISEDGGLNWAAPINITDFAYPDLDCPSQDTLVCDRDTFRVYTDCAALFDRCDYLHAAFSTRHYWELEGTISRSFSEIWHWSEEYGEISNITKGEFGIDWTDSTWNSPWMDCGAWQMMVQRPSLAEDTVTGYLYCSYQRYDTMQISEALWPMSEAYLAVSRNMGRTWSAGTNVSQTIAIENAPAGQCMHERDITIGDYVTYDNGIGYVHMFYCFDGDAGTPLQDEGAVTLNPLRYQRIPISEIPATPINPWWQMNMHADSSDMVTIANPEEIILCGAGVGDARGSFRPESFRLYQNYPNPFNPTTNIQFDLARNANVTLKIYNVAGQEVATLFSNAALSAGVQTVTFDATNLSSGVYVYRINVDGVTSARKMVLMK